MIKTEEELEWAKSDKIETVGIRIFRSEPTNVNKKGLLISECTAGIFFSLTSLSHVTLTSAMVTCRRVCVCGGRVVAVVSIILNLLRDTKRYSKSIAATTI